MNPPRLREDHALPLVPVYREYCDYSKYYVDVDAFFAAITDNERREKHHARTSQAA